ncbi:murein hydrolase activator EnvC family protein [Streptomyces herbicida]|uniref:murein hydrolase activator EnvC family protein n=1 Tax=Streptomyces herbicida TaxID=3065675 RepID=UPI0038CD7821
MRRARRCGWTWAGLLLGLSAVLLTPPARADVPPPAPPAPVPAIGRAWPVGTRPAVLRGWEPPATPYGPGHRGVDLAAAPGAPVRSVAAGRVSFAGRVAGRGVISVELEGTDLRTTYEPVLPSVKKGDEVAAGEVVGVLEPTGSHCGSACLHWGLLRGETYLDPLSLLPPWLLNRGPSRLLPVLGVPLPA